MKAAIAAGEVSRGWIPAFVPEAATDIRLKYDVENNRTWLAFRGLIERSTLQYQCLSASSKEITFPSSGPRGWWPGVLTGDSSDGKSAYAYYSCKDGEIVATDETKGEVFLWRLAK